MEGFVSFFKILNLWRDMFHIFHFLTLPHMGITINRFFLVNSYLKKKPIPGKSFKSFKPFNMNVFRFVLFKQCNVYFCVSRGKNWIFLQALQIISTKLCQRQRPMILNYFLKEYYLHSPYQTLREASYYLNLHFFFHYSIIRMTWVEVWW